MLRRLTFGLLSLAAAAAFAACSSSDTTALSSGGVNGLGPNIPTGSLYVTNSTQNAVSIYLPPPVAAATPSYQIGGASTSLAGPQYAAFDTNKRLYVTNYNASTGAASVTFYATYALGNVIPLGSFSGGGSYVTYPHGIAIDSKSDVLVANTRGTSPFTDEIVIIPTTNGTGFFSASVIAGSNTLLSTPWGVGVDASNNIYVSNHGSGTITVYPLPSPSPTVSPTATPAPTPTPTGSPSPTPAPTPFSYNIAPTATIAGLGAPTGLALASNGKIYVADPDNGTPSVFVFNAISAGTATLAARISGPSTGLVFPSDVKVDATGNIYVVDSGALKILIFAPSANGNVPPTVALPYSAGTPIGLAISP